MVIITGQKGVVRGKQAGFQVVYIVSTMTPLTKMAHQIVSAATIPAIVREAFRVAQQERPGPIHLELPEDIAAEQASYTPPIRYSGRSRSRTPRCWYSPAGATSRHRRPSRSSGRARRYAAKAARRMPQPVLDTARTASPSR
ncbi:MAG TPA: hypothetical protein VE687_09470, partial [Stellaceae bacterium]|nr:hypothetical protein [Stellaceae bacterium]